MLKFVLIIFSAFVAFNTRAETVRIAVASNFASPLETLRQTFERTTGHHARVSSAATGTLWIQIQNGAPFDVFLSADMATPEKMIEAGLAFPETRFTYAIGRLALWSMDRDLIDPQGAVLSAGRFRHLSIANPKTAPYGVAAVEVMTRLGLLQHLKSKWVLGENIAQAHQFVASHNADLGFVALSQVVRPGAIPAGSLWIVPQSFYSPLRQDAVLLRQGSHNPAAIAFLSFLKSEWTRRVIASMGYDLQ